MCDLIFTNVKTSHHIKSIRSETVLKIQWDWVQGIQLQGDWVKDQIGGLHGYDQGSELHTSGSEWTAQWRGRDGWDFKGGTGVPVHGTASKWGGGWAVPLSGRASSVCEDGPAVGLCWHSLWCCSGPHLKCLLVGEGWPLLPLKSLHPCHSLFFNSVFFPSLPTLWNSTAYHPLPLNFFRFHLKIWPQGWSVVYNAECQSLQPN